MPRRRDSDGNRTAGGAEKQEEYTMAYLGEEIKKLGFGLMRLPRRDEKIDVEQV